MRPATKDELRILTTFYRTAGLNLGLFDRATRGLIPEAQTDPRFVKNLEILREMKKARRNDVEASCRAALKNNIRCMWISDVPSIADGLDMATNLLTDSTVGLHRLLQTVEVPAVRMEFGSDKTTEALEEPTVTRVEEFTLELLLDTFASAFSISRSTDRDKIWAGAFDYLLRSYSLDVILFAIDFAIDSDDYPQSPLDLQGEYIAEAEAYVKDIQGRGNGRQ
jgi:hypothetical protein